jgi:hypothetical protein
MTVIRENSEEFDSTLPSVVDALEHMLSVGQGSYTYKHTESEIDPTRFKTVVTPKLWPLLLTTRMTISVESRQPAVTVVSVRTQSQWYIFGDIANFYRGYIHDLFESLQRSLGQAT